MHRLMTRTPAANFRSMKTLVDERPDGNAAALYEWASVHDFLGRDTEAIPLYRLALDAGLDDRRRLQVLIQLASSLRYVGEFEAAIRVLEDVEENNVAGDAHRAFLALVLLGAAAIRLPGSIIHHSKNAPAVCSACNCANSSACGLKRVSAAAAGSAVSDSTLDPALCRPGDHSAVFGLVAAASCLEVFDGGRHRCCEFGARDFRGDLPCIVHVVHVPQNRQQPH